MATRAPKPKSTPTKAKTVPAGKWPHAGIPVVDGHVHVNRFDLMTPAAQALIRQNPTFHLMQEFQADATAFLEHMDREGIRQAWLVNYCAKEVMGYGWEVNDWIGGYVEADPTRLVAVGGYDPRHDGDGEEAVGKLADLGIRALKIHAVHQHLRPDGRRLRPALRECERRGMPVIFHTGTSKFPGASNKFGSPSRLRKVCQTFPKLKVVIAHGGRPDETQEALAILAEFPNAWLDVSSCPPKKLPDYFGDLEALAPRTLWGSDWPGPGVPGMGKNVESFLALGLSEKANRMILHDNAATLIGP
ncbi:MAG: amidohydrolase family protein [bacterium]